MNSAALVLFTRQPVPGKTKTRLSPFMSLEQAAELHAACIRDMLTEIRKLRLPFYIFCHPPAAAEYFSSLAPSARVRAQRGGSTDCRLVHLLGVLKREGIRQAAVMVSDCPELKSGILRQALRAVRGQKRQAAVGLSPDGGAYLLALNDLDARRMLTGIPWGSGESTARLVKALVREGFEITPLPVVADMDTSLDVLKLAGRMQRGGHCRNVRKVLERVLKQPSRPVC